jgi:hypothetical protein
MGDLLFVMSEGKLWFGLKADLLSDVEIERRGFV